MSRPPVRDRPLVLVADGDPDLRAYIRDALARGGADSAEAANGPEALVLTRALRPDLVVSDARMPGLGGVALCRALRDDRLTRSVLVLLVSGGTRAPPPCADGFLAKPFNASVLRAEVERLLARPIPATP